MMQADFYVVRDVETKEYYSHTLWEDQSVCNHFVKDFKHAFLFIELCIAQRYANNLKASHTLQVMKVVRTTTFSGPVEVPNEE